MRGLFSFIEQLRYLFNPFARRLNLDVLLAHADPNAPLHEKVLWLQDIVEWLRSPLRTDEKASLKNRRARIQTVRIRFLFHLLERNPSWKSNVAAVLRSILRETSALELFSLTGLIREAGFFSEASNRVMSKVLPSPANERDLATLFTRIFNDETDPDWIENLPREILERIIELLNHENPSGEAVFNPLRNAMVEALLILSPNIAALGLTSDLRSRMANASVEDSPFRALSRKLQEIASKLQTSDVDRLDATFNADQELAACREKIRDVYQHLEESGVSVALVFKLESLTLSLNRVETLLRILLPHVSVDKLTTGERFLAELIRQAQEASGLRQLIRRNLDMIARKVVERVGETGEHYITTTRAEYWQMLRAGAGGGVVTVFTTVLKFAIGMAHMPLFFEGFFLWVNYAGSFLTMQMMHFALATKQPSMTASALANKLRLLSHRRHLQEFVDAVARITRSQFAAAVGNIGLVVPGAILFDLLCRGVLGRPVLSAEYAAKTMESLNPFTSLTIPAAAFTGVLLWLAAVTGGWLENWAVFRRLPEAIATHRRLQAVFGTDGARRLSESFSREINGVGSNVSIAFYLSFAPILGRFFGAPIDIRHVTLSSGSLTFAVCAIGWDKIDKTAFGMACLGIFFILLLNFGVSFALSLSVALRARRIKRAWVHHLLRSVGRRFIQRTRQFFFPVEDTTVNQ